MNLVGLQGACHTVFNQYLHYQLNKYQKRAFGVVIFRKTGRGLSVALLRVCGNFSRMVAVLADKIVKCYD